MTPQELAALLHGREYLKEITDAEEAQAKAAGLVVAFGYSDDNIELRGAINDEVGAYEGTTIRVSPAGLLRDWERLRDSETDEAEFEAYFKAKAAGFREVKAVWSPVDVEGGEPFASWAFKASIPHATFDVMEDGELYCRGIVFRLADAATPTLPMFTHAGEVRTIGMLVDEEATSMMGKNVLTVQSDDGREVHIVGLDEAHLRELAPLFMERATVTIGGAS